MKNPQTGVMVELPGKQIGTVKVLASAGDTPETEYSFVEYSGQGINTSDLLNYYIEEVKE